MNRTIFIVGLAALLASCEAPPVQPDPFGTEAEKLEAAVQSGDPAAIKVRNDQRVAEHMAWTDPVTGCDYIYPTYQSHGSQLRMDRDGFHGYCAEQKERDRLEAAGLPVPEAPAE